MLRVNHATNFRASHGHIWRRVVIARLNDWRTSAYSLLLFSILLIILSNLVHGDDLTGQAFDDPKDLLPGPVSATASKPTGQMGLFVPMPVWARDIVMPSLPSELKPMGGKTAVAGPLPPPPPLAPPKEAPTTVSTAASSTPTKPTEKTTSAPAENSPALISVSPFLQWIKTNPQAAATEARQQAAGYHAAPPAEGGAASAVGNTVPGGTGTPGGTGDPYWLPPLIDSADFGTSPVSGSAAIYSTPQR